MEKKIQNTDNSTSLQFILNCMNDDFVLPDIKSKEEMKQIAGYDDFSSDHWNDENIMDL